MTGLRVRDMALADCERVAEIRVRGWQTAYAGLMPQSYLDALSVRQDAERRRTFWERGDAYGVNLIAELDGEITGWACHGPYRDGAIRTADAELYALYVHPERWGRGVGRALLTEAVRRCADAGHARMALWVLEENTRARRFYERAGFAADGAAESFEVDGVPVPEVRHTKILRG
ncbi:GNAT family N-acetyltransferase [Streptomyces sp. NPDC046197]|uniref:GNAT family N-acetyltransferase n=1 Tax=Streptomyces sp. NPDC046197 TaxID=3154337 RepID=UPI00341160B5